MVCITLVLNTYLVFWASYCILRIVWQELVCAFNGVLLFAVANGFIIEGAGVLLVRCPKLPYRIYCPVIKYDRKMTIYDLKSGLG